MSYTINRTDQNGAILVTIVDGTADGPDINPGLNASDVDLFGKNYPTYGQDLNQNFIRLLQNFANSTPPIKPLTGELWYDTTTGLLKVFNNTSYVPVSPVVVANTAPSTTTVGSQWWDYTNQQLNIWNGTSWTTTGPAYKYSNLGISGVAVEAINDTVGGSHIVTKFYQSGNVTAISSYDSAFTISPANPVTGFSTVYPGITMANGVANECQFVGSATNAKMLGNIVSSKYARTDIDSNFAGNVAITNVLTVSSITTGSTYTAGNIVGQWTLGVNSTLNASYADLAEFYEGDAEYEVGTVLIFGGSKEVTTTTLANDTRAAGVVSNNAAYSMNSTCSGLKNLVALAGRVQCKVVGPVQKGDMLTTSNMPGYATKATMPILGSIIGKSLEDKGHDIPGIIEVAIGRF